MEQWRKSTVIDPQRKKTSSTNNKNSNKQEPSLKTEEHPMRLQGILWAFELVFTCAMLSSVMLPLHVSPPSVSCNRTFPGRACGIHLPERCSAYWLAVFAGRMGKNMNGNRTTVEQQPRPRIQELEQSVSDQLGDATAKGMGRQEN